jgi:hypothetical protein
VLELGGSGSLSHDTNFTQIGLSPSFGWFFINYVALSFLPELDYAKTGTAAATARYRVLVEPSFHSQLEGQLFAVFGAGVGLAYEKTLGAGLALAPRAGLKIVVGGSGVLTMVFEYVYASNAEKASADGSDAQHSATYGVRGGYSIAW